MLPTLNGWIIYIGIDKLELVCMFSNPMFHVSYFFIVIRNAYKLSRNHWPNGIIVYWNFFGGQKMIDV